MIYIAGPFFNEAQVARIRLIEDLCEENRLPYFSPRLRAPVLNSLDEQDRKKAIKGVFNSNVYGLNNSSVLLADLTDKDTGTIWELGYFFALSNGRDKKGNLAIISYSQKAEAVNVMLSRSTYAHISETDELVRFFSSLGEKSVKLPLYLAAMSSLPNNSRLETSE
ncbi:MAG: hypothetical protein EB165_04640 [Euryarchaeota archaeon]|nr:hypothetical protein [Euryarchaeota archaeon]